MKVIFKKTGLNLIVVLSILLFFPFYSPASQWVNPKEAIGDPMLARLQQERKELTEVEKKEIEKYGYTGLEIMTYVDYNRNPGQDNDDVHRCVNVNGNGSLRVGHSLTRRKYYYKSYLSKLTNDGIKPGDMEYKQIFMMTAPSANKGTSSLYTNYLQSEKKQKERESWFYSNKLRKARREANLDRQEEYGNHITTREDDEGREPWEEDHRIIGEDDLRGFECLVIESKHRLAPNYYLTKRVTWVEKNNFLELHEEQFDGKGKLYKVFDKDWFQLRPSNYWVVRETNVVKLPLHARTIHQTPEWFVNLGLKEEDFSERVLKAEKIWRKWSVSLPPLKQLSDLPPEPKIRGEFWNRIGIKPEVSN